MSQDLVDDAGAVGPEDPSEAKASRARGRAKSVLAMRREVLKALLSQPVGRSWLWDLVESGGVMRNPTVLGDPHMTYFNVGRQDFARELLASLIDADPEAWARASREARQPPN